MSDRDFAANLERFTGFADWYDRFRAPPPARLGRCPSPALVVDLGSGTGLSTRYWAAHAHSVIGIEPTDSMRQQAEAMGGANISYRHGFSHATGLPDHCAEIVSCAQSLHWMDPFPTFREVARILKPGGVFAACDYDWPPVTGAWEVDALYNQSVQEARRLEREHRIAGALQQWDKAEHTARLRASGCFRHVTEVVLHHVDEGNAERLVGLFLSQGHVRSLLKRGVSEEALGVVRLRELADRLLGATPQRWFWSSRIRLGIV